MKFSISNIAWPQEEEEIFLKLIKELGCSGVEIASSKIWPEPVKSTLKQRKSYKSLIQKYCLEIPAMQALLYSRRDLGLFRSHEIEVETIDYLKRLCQLAADIGAKILVFGSPANRKRGGIPIEEAFERAASFFSKIATAAEGQGVCICIEPLRPQETDFVTTALEGFKLVNMVDSPGFGLHLDGKAVSEEGKPFSKTLMSVKSRLKHFHINDPGLKEINCTGKIDHIALGKALRSSGYDRYVSIEMRTVTDYYDAVKRSIEYSKRVYIDYDA